MTQRLMNPLRRCLLSIIVLAGSTVIGLDAFAQMDPMPGMSTGHAASRAAGMTEMMGAPGLLPFDVMTGQAGQWMIGYQFMHERLEGNIDGSGDVSTTKILERFATAPVDMSMNMHMGMIMYAPTNRLTLMAMLSYVTMSMKEQHRDSSQSTERSSGFGDLELRGSYSLYAPTGLHHRLLANFGFGLPTGSINQRDAEGMRMEYPMQIGSGSFSVLPGLTYLGQALPWGWAVDMSSTVRLGRNDNGYKLGNRYQASASVAREFAKVMSASSGLRGESWATIDGSDPLLDPADEPTKNALLQGGRRLSLLMGITLHPQAGFFKNQHFHVLGEVPVAQSLDGPQLKRSWLIRLGWQVEF